MEAYISKKNCPQTFMNLICGILHLGAVRGFVRFLRLSRVTPVGFRHQEPKNTDYWTIILQNGVPKKHQFKIKIMIISNFDIVHFGSEELFGRLVTVRWAEVRHFQPLSVRTSAD